MVFRAYFGVSCGHLVINKLFSCFRFSFLVVMMSLVAACNSGGGDDSDNTTTYYLDSDGDGYGDFASTQSATSQPAGYVINKTDCDDNSPAINPAAAETNDGVDNNCDGQVDEGFITYYQDFDGDSYGDPASALVANSQPAGYVLDNTDCDDSSAAINPGATEIIDGVDNNCDGQVDDVLITYFQDADSDGYGNAAVTQSATSQPAGYVLDNTDCDDSSTAVNPGAAEINDGIDNNCDGQVDEGFVTYYQDADSDGHGNPAVTQVATSPPAGYVANSTDCDDSSAAVHPGATEISDGIDNNCNDQVDEGFVTYYRDADSDGYGDPTNTQVADSQPAGYVSNSSDCDDSSAAVNPGATEVADGIDNDCDSLIDETLAATSGSDVGTGWEHSCAIIDGSVRCLGSNTYGQLDVPALVNPRKISAGQQHSCAIDDTGVVCWGSNSNGQITVPTLSNPVEISTGGFHSCAIDDNGVTCWGYSLYGQANLNGTNANLNPRKLSLGTFHTCWVDDNGVSCGGDSRKGQSTVPGTLVNPVDVAAGNEHTCAIDDNGATCWGSSVSGYFNPIPVLVNPTEITAGANLTCALDDTGVVCWGFGYTTQLIVPASVSPKKISAGSNFACAVVAEEVKCWGSTSNSKQPSFGLEPPLISTPIQVSLGRYHGCVLDGSGVRCWGSGTISDFLTLIPELLNPFAVSAGGEASCALDDTGAVCWPDGVSAAYSYSESRIILNNPTQLSVGGANACALEDAGVVCWGAAGVLYTDVPALVNSSEVQVGGTGQFCAIDDTGLVCWGDPFYFGMPANPLSNPHGLTIGVNDACVIDDSGAVCWGANNAGVSYSSVPPLSNPTQISMGQNIACALDDTGVVCWGAGYSAGSMPVLLNPQRVDVGENAICVTDDAGMVCW